MRRMKPAFKFLDLLPLQVLGGAAIVAVFAGRACGGVWLPIGFVVGALLLVAALRSVPMQ
jgi:hypothetical protein